MHLDIRWYSDILGFRRFCCSLHYCPRCCFHSYSGPRATLRVCCRWSWRRWSKGVSSPEVAPPQCHERSRHSFCQNVVGFQEKVEECWEFQPWSHGQWLSLTSPLDNILMNTIHFCQPSKPSMFSSQVARLDLLLASWTRCLKVVHLWGF